MTYPAIGSGLMSQEGALVPHRMTKEIADLRADIVRQLRFLCNQVVVEYTNPAAASTNAILLAKASTVAVQSYSAAAGTLDGAIGAATLPYGRNITVTTAGVTPTDAPATLTIVGLGRDLVTQKTESLSVGQSATTVVGAKIFYKILSLSLTAGDGTGATVAVGFGSLLGLPCPAVARAGIAAAPILKEIAAGSVVTNGVLNQANGSYAPNSVPNGTNDYAIYYEGDPTVIQL